MRIAHIAPPWISIPPKNYGGTENVLYHLVEEQVAQGHDVTLFAPGDAQTSARHIAFFAQSLFECGVPWQSHPKAFYHLYKAIEYLHKHAYHFDILHTHLSSSSDIYLFPLTSTLHLPHITTLHSQFPFDRINSTWLGDADQCYMEWLSHIPLVAISKSERIQEQAKFPLNFIDVVYHGIDLHEFPQPCEPENFFAWVGRLVPDKGVHLAIEAAQRANVPLIIAGIVDRNIPEACRYFEEEIKPHLDGQQIRYIGPVCHEQRNDLFRRARGFLNPLQWEEPFGMVMLEAMAVGCPVIAFRRGAAEELISTEQVGFLVENVEQMVERIPALDRIDRLAVREYVETYFSASRMAKNYTCVYKKVAAATRQRSRALARIPGAELPIIGSGPDRSLSSAV
jgi:glycosyltransferase involved in cell wall biosynthesis